MLKSFLSHLLAFFVVSTVKSDPRLEFLAPLIPPTIPISKALELKKAHVSSTGNLQSDDEASVEAV